jgi:hypothetical protein
MLSRPGITRRCTASNHPEGNRYIERYHSSIARWIEEWSQNCLHRGLHGRKD